VLGLCAPVEHRNEELIGADADNLHLRTCEALTREGVVQEIGHERRLRTKDEVGCKEARPDAKVRQFNRVPTIGESVSAGHLGGQLPARSFIAVPGQAGADVLFLDGAQRDIRVCAAPGAAGRTLYSIVVNGQRATEMDAGQPVFFAAGGSFFVEAYDTASYDALRRGLGLAPGRC